MKRWTVLSVVFLLYARPVLYGQEINVHPELQWFTIKTEHFEIHYHEGAERTARAAAKIAEEIYGPITHFYGWRPDGTIHFIIKDHDDNSNGAAFYYDNKVEIWAPQMSFILRGEHNWLRNVMTHEFSHMVSLGAARKLPRQIPAAYFQWINYEPEKRDDVLYGYPNQLASYAVPMTVMPMWLAEGMAQYMAPNLDYDRWDTHRDMLIRTAVMEDRLPDFSEMGVFGRNSIGNERTYNTGYALTRYIAHRWGPEALPRLSRALRKPHRFTVHGALREVTGLDGRQLYAEWKSHLETSYRERLSVVLSNRREGRKIVDKGIGNIAPAWSPDGKRLAYCGSKTSDYLTMTNLMLYDFDKGKSVPLKTGVNSRLAWSPDGGTILYSRLRRNRHQSRFFDLHLFNLKSKKEKRLTHGLRVVDAAWSPDGREIVAVTQKDGTENLLLLNSSGQVIRPLTHFQSGEGVYTPCFSPDGREVVFSQARRHGRDLVRIDLESGEIRPLIRNQGDARDPHFAPDGSLFFSWDVTGIANIYRLAPGDTTPVLLTNVVGGAFMPSVSSDGRLAFSLFDGEGYKIALLDSLESIPPEKAFYSEASHTATELDNRIDAGQWVSVREYDDTRLPDLDAKPYTMTYGKLSFLPRLMVDSLRLKVGTYFYANEVLDRFNVLGGAAVNGRRDLDIFSIFEYRNLPPTLFVEFYYFTRNVKREIAVIEDYPHKVPIDVHFRLVEGDVGAYYPVAEDQTVRLSVVHSRSTSDIGDFYFRPQRIQFRSPANTYYIGNHLRLQWQMDQRAPGVDAAANPTAGRRVNLQLSHEWNNFFVGYSTENENILPQKEYALFSINKVELEWQEYLRAPWARRHGINLLFRGGWIDRPVDSFFNFFAGGLPGLRGYPYYAIEGRKMLIGRAVYRFPLFSRLQKQVLHLTTDKLFLSAFYEIGNAFDEDRLDLSDMKRCWGIGGRAQLFSFYGFPTAVAFDAAYGIDPVVNRSYRFGREWRYYVTLLFDFID
ncbi:MAG: hypothetical protein ONB12_02575 [candidate division KSB1 bacterium]|nr:hypothetical protein [candidate division KSB1 bacterium]